MQGEHPFIKESFFALNMIIFTRFFLCSMSASGQLPHLLHCSILYKQLIFVLSKFCFHPQTLQSLILRLRGVILLNLLNYVHQCILMYLLNSTLPATSTSKRLFKPSQNNMKCSLINDNIDSKLDKLIS